MGLGVRGCAHRLGMGSESRFHNLVTRKKFKKLGGEEPCKMWGPSAGEGGGRGCRGFLAILFRWGVPTCRVNKNTCSHSRNRAVFSGMSGTSTISMAWQGIHKHAAWFIQVIIQVTSHSDS